MSEALSIDTLVVGGGVAGLFALDALVRAGHCALLLERAALGLGQTTSSQGILHAGVKYSLGGIAGDDAREAAAAMKRGWLSAWPETKAVVHPMADGGDGSLDVVRAALGGEWKSCTALDARGRPREVQWLWQPDKGDAWIETARVVGLAGLPDEERNPLSATSAGPPWR